MYTRALRRNPGHLHALLGFAQLAQIKGEMALAEEHYARALDFHEASLDAMIHLGLFYETAKGNTTQADVMYSRAQVGVLLLRRVRAWHMMQDLGGCLLSDVYCIAPAQLTDADRAARCLSPIIYRHITSQLTDGDRAKDKHDMCKEQRRLMCQ